MDQTLRASASGNASSSSYHAATAFPLASGLGYDYAEWWGTLSVDARHRISLSHSNDIFGTGAGAWYYAVATTFELPAGLALELEAGRFDLRRAWGEAYHHATLALSGEIDALSWRVAEHLTDDKAREMFYDPSSSPTWS